MKKNIMKTFVIAGMMLAAVSTLAFTSVDAQSIYSDYSETVALSSDTEYTLEEMLNYALQDEYMAQAEYQAIIDEFGAVQPFSRIVLAEETHIQLILSLYEAYGLTVPENNAADSVVIPESITSALSTGVEAEEANIAMYQIFLAQSNLPDDVRTAFESLQAASQNHLAAFSGDHYAYYGSDMMRQARNQWQKMLGELKGKLNQNQSRSNGSNGNQGAGANCQNS